MRTITVLSALALAGTAFAGLADQQTDANPGASSFVDDGTVNVGEYAATYTNGGGSGFGGALGNGSISMDTDGTNLYIGVSLAGGGNNVVLWLDTGEGGQQRSDMNDTADTGRNQISNFYFEGAQLSFPTRVEYGIIFEEGNGTVAFITNDGNTPGHLTFDIFSNDQTSTNFEVAVPLASLGSPEYVNFFSGLISGSFFASNETLPAQPDYNAADNPGFASPETSNSWTEFNQFVLPTPGATALFGLAALGATRRRR